MKGKKKGLSRRIQWISNILKHGLFWRGVRIYLARIGFDFMPYYWMSEATKPIKEPEIKGGDKDFEISIYGEDITKFVIDKSAKDLLADFKSGDTCIGLNHKGNVAAYMLIKRKPFAFRERFFDLKPNEAYLHSMYTFKQYRGKNIAPFLRFHSYEHLKKEGVDTFLSVSEYFNKPTIRFKQKLNSHPLKLYLCVVLFKKRYYNFTLKTFSYNKEE